MLKFKRLMSFLLALALLAGMMPPVQVRAEEVQDEVLETVGSEPTFISEETEETETTACTEETEEPETTGATEETEVPETTVPEEETEETETTAATEEAVFADIVIGDILDANQEAADATNSCGANATWSYSNGKLSITGSGDMENYTYYSSAPWYDYRASIKTVSIGTSITGIGDYAFHNCTALTSITIPTSVTKIGNSAFRDCSGLASVTVPGNVKSIGDYAFVYCYGLTDVTLSSGVTNIGNYAFSNCTKLTGVSLPSSITSIGVGAFKNCDALTAISIPSQIKKIPESMYDDCDGLTSVTIPSHVTAIGEKAFHYCYKLSSVTVPGNVTSIGNSAFSECTGLTNLTISSGVTQIGDSAFSGCSKLTAVAIPDGVVSVGASAFANCDALTNVTIPYTVTNIGAGVFRGSEKLEEIWVNPANTVYSSDEYGVLFDKEKTLLIQAPGTLSGHYNLSETVTAIGDYAFYNCTALTGVTMGDRVATVGKHAFEGCTALADVTLGSGVTTLDESAFNNCDSLTHILLPEGLETVSKDAFYDCDGLTGLEIPASVKTLALYTDSYSSRTPFYSCGALEEIRVAEDNENYASDESGVLYNKDMTTLLLAPAAMTGSYTTAATTTTVSNYAFDESSLSEVTLSEGVTKISRYGFYKAKVRKVTVPDSVTTMESYSFSQCNSLTELKLGTGITTINSYTIHSCTGLQSLYVPSSVTKINSTAFQGCTKLSAAYIPSGVTAISSTPFSSCSSSLVLYCGASGQPTGWSSSWDYINSNTDAEVKWSVTEDEGKFWTEDAWDETVVMPEYISTIPRNAFRAHTNLKKITIAPGVPEIPPYAFYGCTALTGVQFPAYVTSIGTYAFYGCTALTNVMLPSRVTSIGDYAFNGCKALEKVYIPKSVTTIAASSYTYAPFYNCTSSLTLYCEADSKPSGWSTHWNRYSSSYTLPTIWSVTPEAAKFWLEDSQQTHVVIPEGATSIPDDAFRGRTDIISVTIPDTVTSIGADAFYGCTGLTSITIPDSVATIGNYAFAGCSGLTSVTLPNGLKTINQSLFRNCTGLTSVTIPESVTYISTSAFYNCSGLKFLTIPDSVTTIELSAFSACTGLKMIFIPDSVTKIDSTSTSGSAFSGCDASLIIFCEVSSKPSAWDTYWNRTTATGSEAYTTCWSTTPEVYQFWSVTSRSADVVIPDTITEIPAYAFYNRTDLKSVSVAQSVTSIGKYAFSGCTGLETVRFQGAAPGIATNAFSGTETSVFHPSGDESWTADVKQNYGGTLYWDGMCAQGHTVVVEEAKEATCSEAGWTQSSYCSVCKTVLTARTEIPAKGHTEVTVKEVPPTCTEVGYTESVICGTCGHVFKAAEEIPAGHKPVTDPAVAPTCTEDGLTEGSHCEGCGEVYKKQEVVPAAHTPVTDPAVAPDCKEPGLTEGSHCRICGEVIAAQQEVPAVGHTFTNGTCICGAETGTCGENLTWMLEKDGVLTVSGSGMMEDYAHGEAPWFGSRQSVREVVIGEQVGSIGKYAFSYCTNVKKITFHGSAPAEIGSNAFWMINGATVTFAYDETWTQQIRGNYGGIGIVWFSDCGGSHIPVTDPAVAPTCTEDGLSEGSHCDACGQILTEQTDVPALGHTEVTDEAVAPTCTETGLTEGSHCSVCKEKVIAQKTVDKLAHDYENGVCKVCRLAEGLEYSVTDGQVVYSKYSGDAGNLVLPKSIAGRPVNQIADRAFEGSNLETLVIPNSITGIGADAFSGCVELTDIYYGGSRTRWQKTGVQVPAGINVHCGVSDPETHWTTKTTDPTCAEPGYTYETCACGYERNRTAADEALGHTEVVDQAVAPTCTTPGLTAGSHCGRCAETLVKQETVEKLGHEMGLWTVVRESTCTESGVKERTCIRGDYTQSAVLATVEHVYENGICKNCRLAQNLDYTLNEEEAVYKEYSGDAETLILPESIAGKPVTEIGAGTFADSALTALVIPGSVAKIGEDAFAGCDELKDIYYGGSMEQWRSSGAQVPETTNVHYAVTDPAAHWETETVAPTCTENGYSYERCACGHRRAPVITEGPAGHKEVTDEAVAPTCTETGLAEGSHCSVCSLVLTEQAEVPALGHTEVTDEAVAPTCKDPGFTESVYCGVCGEQIKAAQIVPAAHKTVTDPAVAATCTQTGLTEGSHCSACNQVLVSQEIIPITHVPVTDAAVAPTCKKIGLTEGSHCELCGEVLAAQQQLPATGHTFENGVCACGVSSGSCGETLTWLLDEGVLSVSGSGSMADYARGQAPWYDKRNTVEKIVIGSGVNSIGSFAFSYCTNVKQIVFEADAPDKIGLNAFEKVVATAIFSYNESWTREIRQNYGGTIQWFSDCGGSHIVVIDAAVAPACTETGWTEGSHCDACGEILVAREELPALGHKTVTDEAVEETCTRDGLTEGSHCDACGEIFTAQQVIDNLAGHNYIQEEDHFVCTQCQDVTTLTITREYILLRPGQEIELKELVYPESVADSVIWYSNGDRVEGSRFASGEACTVYITAELGGIQSAPCRIDVAEAREIRTVQLSSTALTLELYSKNYTELELLLQLPGNDDTDSAAQAAAMAAEGVEKNGKAIRTAEFVNSNGIDLSELFDISILDDRRVVILPTEYAVANPALVAKSYQTAIRVAGEGFDCTSETLTLTVKKTLPKLKATVAAFNSFYSGQKQEIVITGGAVTGIKATELPSWLKLEKNALVLTEDAPQKSVSGKAYLLVETEEWAPVAVTVSVKNTYKAPALKLSASSVTLNRAVENTVYVGLTANQAEYVVSDPGIRITGEKEVGQELIASYGDGKIVVRTTDKTPEKATYKLYIGTPGCKEVALTVKIISAEPTVTYKASGNMDLSIPGQAVTVTPTFKNYSGAFSVESVAAQNSKKEAVGFFHWKQVDNQILVNCDGDTPTGSYTLTVKLADSRFKDGTVKVTVKRTAVKLNLSASKVTMNKDLKDQTAVAVTCTTAGYPFNLAEAVLAYDENALKVERSEENLVITLAEGAEYGKTYPISVSACYQGAPAVKLSITVAKQNAAIKSTIKATGTLDVIRAESRITVRPTYTNVANVDLTRAVLKIYSSADKYAVPIAQVKAEDGVFVVDKTVISDHTLKYKAQLETDLYGEGKEPVKSAQISLRVTMGSAKLTVRTSGTTMFAKDKYDSALVWFEAADTTLNDVVRVEIKDAKYRDLFRIIRYENGQFAIGYKDNAVHSSLIGKKATTAVTLNLNVFLEGNGTEKANTTAKVTLTIVK